MDDGFGRGGAAWVALCRSQAVIEFDTNGIVQWANETFLTTMGYALEDVVGRHHRMFCATELIDSPAYAAFWRRLANGEFHSGEYARRSRSGATVYLQATYNPVLNAEGRPERILKIATDVTERRRQSAELQAIMTAMDRSQAVVEFAVDGTVLTANRNFLHAFGYERDEVIGRHHRMFCDPVHAASANYAAFWRKLGAGNFDAGTYRRVARNGRNVWLQATYNPILDPCGRPLKIVKFAMDITEAKERAAEDEGRKNAIDLSQAVVEFDLNGKVLEANANFLKMMGYDRSELIGRHHSILCDKSQVLSSTTGRSGPVSAGANTTWAATSGLEATAARSGFRRPTTRSSTPTAGRARSSRSRPTYPIRWLWNGKCSTGWRRGSAFRQNWKKATGCSRRPWASSPRSSRASPPSPTRPTCWRSMP